MIFVCKFSLKTRKDNCVNVKRKTKLTKFFLVYADVSLLSNTQRVSRWRCHSWTHSGLYFFMLNFYVFPLLLLFIVF